MGLGSESCVIMTRVGVCNDISAVRKTGMVTCNCFAAPIPYSLRIGIGGAHKANKMSASSYSSSKGWEWGSGYSFARNCGSWRILVPSIRRKWKRNMTSTSRIRAAAGEEKKIGYKGYPPMQNRPKWHWRVLACFPYLTSFHVVWVFSETAYSIHPFLEDFEFFTHPFLVNGLGRLPGWFFTAYFFAGYLGIVRNNKFPHFLRFHVINGMLLEILFSVCGQINDWVPKSFYWGKAGQLFWFFVSFAYLFTVLLCILCALKGWYADVPFLCDAAYMQIPY